MFKNLQNLNYFLTALYFLLLFVLSISYSLVKSNNKKAGDDFEKKVLRPFLKIRGIRADASEFYVKPIVLLKSFILLLILTSAFYFFVSYLLSRPLP